MKSLPKVLLPFVLLLPFALLCGIAMPAHAQDEQQLPGPYSVAINTVDVATAIPNVAIPVYSKAGRGVPFSLTMYFRNPAYVVSNDVNRCPAPSYTCWQEIGNHKVSNYDQFTESFTATPLGSISMDGPSWRPGDCGRQGTYHYDNIQYQDALGVRQPLAGPLYVPNSYGCVPTTITKTLTDGSGITYHGDTSVTGWGGGKVTFPNGSFYNQDNGVSLTDSNGNYIQYVQDDISHQHWVDTLGTTVLSVTFVSSTQTTYTYTGSDGLGKVVTVNYTTRPTPTSAFNCSGVTEISGGTLTDYLPSSVVYPDGSRYSFTFETHTERLASVTHPNGLVTTYTYPGNDGFACNGFYSSPQINLTENGYTWKYSTSFYNGNQGDKSATVTDPAGNVSSYYFKPVQGVGYYKTQETVHQGVNVGIETIDTCYNGTSSPCPSTAFALPITQVSSTLTLLPNGPVSKKVYFLTSYNLLQEEDVYDFGPTLHHHLYYGYGSWNGSTCTLLGNNISSRPCYVQKTDTSSNQLSLSTFVYDEGSVASTSGTPNQVSITGSRGNLTTSSVWTGGTSYITSTNTYFDTGEVATSTGPNGSATSTSFTYGDCGNSLLTGVSMPLSLSVSRTHDTGCFGAVVVSATDVNSYASSLAYSDPLWRATSIGVPSLEVSGTVYANTTYISPTQTETVLNFNGGNSTLDAVSTLFPSLNSVEGQDLEAPSSSNWDTSVSDFVWDSTGIKNESYLPCVATSKGGSCTGAKSTVTHDALGRPIVRTDGGLGTVTYSYVLGSNTYDVVAELGPAPTGEVTKKVRKEYNGLGQLLSVCKVSSATGTVSCGPNGGTGFLTTFTYNADGTLQQAVRGSQTHSFTYDKIGRVLTSTTPEGGLKQFFFDSAPSAPGVACSSLSLPTNYSPIGHLLKTYDANGITACYSYDQIGRNTGIAYSGTNSDGLNKYFVYDSAIVNSVAMVNAKGRIAEAYTAPTIAGTKVTDEGFSYNSNDQIADLYQWSTHSGGWYHTSATYFDNGALHTLAGISGGTWTFGLDGKGRSNTALQGTTNEVTGATFNAADQPLTITFGLGDVDTYTYDANTGRMKSYDFAIKATPVHFTGTPNWNQNGTLRGLTIVDGINTGAPDSEVCAYGDATHPGYDEIGRLLKVDCWNGATAVWGQDYTYGGAYDNLSKTVPSGQTGTTWTPSYNSANNQYSSATYDSNGNVKTDTFHTYTWNQDNHPMSVDGITTTYDAFGRMVEKYDGTTYQQELMSPVGPVALMTGQTVTQLRVPLPGGATALSGINFEHKDWLGSASFVSNRNRTATVTRLFSPYGEIYNTTGITGDVDFTGDRQDLAVGLYDTPNRELNPSGRWTSPDPAGDSWNAYAYSTNPMGETDPTGLNNIDDFGARSSPGNTNNFNAFDSSWKHLWVDSAYRNQVNWDNHEASGNPDHAPLPGGRDANGNFVGTFAVVNYETGNEMGFGAPAQNSPRVYPANFIGPLQKGDVRGPFVADTSGPKIAPLQEAGNPQASHYYGESDQCVALTKDLSGMGGYVDTTQWEQGPKVVGNDIQRGTAIATFVDRTYPQEGHRNSGIYMGTGDRKGSILILDQSSGHLPQIRALAPRSLSNVGQLRFLLCDLCSTEVMV